MTVQQLELAIIATGMVLIPLFTAIFAWFRSWLINKLQNERQRIQNEMKMIISEHYNSLDDLIGHNKNNINQLKFEIDHEKSLLNLKLEAMQIKISEIDCHLKEACSRARNAKQED